MIAAKAVALKPAAGEAFAERAGRWWPGRIKRGDLQPFAPWGVRTQGAGPVVMGAWMRRGEWRVRLFTPRVLAVALPAATLALPASARAAGAEAVSWGENWHGELGALYRDNWEEGPVAVEGQSNMVAVAAGGGSNLALLADGTVNAWGGNRAGQLGDGTNAATWEKGASHVSVSGLTGVRAVSAAGDHSLALMQDGTVRAWGDDQFGEGGNGTGGFESETHEVQTLPKAVSGLAGAIAIAAGRGTNFALMSDHTVRAWGWDNKGQLGVDVPEACRLGVGVGACPQFECRGEAGAQLCSKVPRPVEALDATGRHSILGGVTAIAAGGESAYALMKNGQVMAWGANNAGQLGLGSKARARGEANVPPTAVISARTSEPLQGVASIAAGGDHALALLGSGQVVGWGDNQKGALGGSSQAQCGMRPCDSSAVAIDGLPASVSAISAGVQYSLVLSAGTVYAFGKDEAGQLADGATSNAPVPRAIPGLANVTAIAAGETHAVALLAAGTQAPRPLITLASQRRSLTVGWAFDGFEKIACGTFEPRGAETEAPSYRTEVQTLSPNALRQRAVTITEVGGKPLEARPYLVRLEAAGKRRVVVGTPLP